jgi:hypothetical protein
MEDDEDVYVVRMCNRIRKIKGELIVESISREKDSTSHLRSCTTCIYGGLA